MVAKLNYYSKNVSYLSCIFVPFNNNYESGHCIDLVHIIKERNPQRSGVMRHPIKVVLLQLWVILHPEKVTGE
jgi:hypothetical protein